MDGRDRSQRMGLLTDALCAQGTMFRSDAVLAWFHNQAKGVDPLWVEGTLEAGTVNNPARRHYPSSGDLVFARGDGMLERYDAMRHGRWSALGQPLPASPPDSTDSFELIEGEGMRGWPSHEEPREQRRRAS